MMNRHSGFAKSHQHWIFIFLVVCVSDGFSTSVAIVQGPDYVVIAVDSARTRVGKTTGRDIGSLTQCKLYRAGTLYFVLAGHTITEQYNAQLIGNEIANATDDPLIAAAKFEDTITPRFNKLIARLNSGEDVALLRRITPTQMLLGVAFIAFRNGVPVMGTRSFSWEKVHARFSLAPTQTFSCVGPCHKGTMYTTFQMGECSGGPQETLRNKAMAVSAAYELVQLCVNAFPKTVREPIVEVTLDRNGERWASGEAFCKNAGDTQRHDKNPHAH